MMSTTRRDLRSARRGDREAIARLLMHNEIRLARLAQARLGAELKAKMHVSDILQSTFLDVLRSIRRFDGSSDDDFVAWVVTVLENNIRDKGKFFAACKRRPEDEVSEGITEDLGLTSGRRSPSSQAAISEDLVRVSQALDRLPDDYRRVILLRMVDGRATDEVASLIDRTPTATRSLLSRARAQLVLEIDRLRE